MTRNRTPTRRRPHRTHSTSWTGSANCRRCAPTPTWVHAIRAGLLLVITWPWLTLTAHHLWTHHTLTGLPDTLILTTLDGTLAWTAAALHDPWPALLQTLLLALATRIALPPHHKCRHR